MKNVFELINNTNEMVVLRVNADDNLIIALNPYISGDMDYITVTKGENHTLTIIKKNGKTWSFDWGVNGYTLISSNTELLRKKVIHFIEQECHILLEWKGGRPREIKIFYNRNYGKWQLTLEGKNNAYYWSETADSFPMMALECQDILKPYGIKQWNITTAATGITVYKAVY